jgi:hypothetical protein
MDANLKFTMEHRKSSIPFLDVSVIKKEEKIITDVFYKRTDTHQYLHFSSSHPRHTKRAIPYNLARRICTIVSEDLTREQRLEELRIKLPSKTYRRRNQESQRPQQEKYHQSNNSRRINKFPHSTIRDNT